MRSRAGVRWNSKKLRPSPRETFCSTDGLGVLAHPLHLCRAACRSFPALASHCHDDYCTTTANWPDPRTAPVAFVRSYVIHHGCCGQLPLRLAHAAAKMPTRDQLYGRRWRKARKLYLASAHSGSSFLMVVLRYPARSTIHKRTRPIRIPIINVIVVSA